MLRASVDVELREFADTLQEAALGLIGWQTPLARLAAMTGSKAGEIVSIGDLPCHMITEVSAEELGAFAAARGHDPEVNSRIRIGLAARELQILTEADFDTAGDCARHREYGEVIEQIDIPFGALTILEKRSDATVGLTLLHTRRAGAMTRDQIRLMEMAAPMVRTAFRLHQATEGRAVALTLSALEQRDQAAFVLDRQGRVKSLSTSAEALLRDGSLRLVNGRLNDPRDSLKTAVDKARLGGQPPIVRVEQRDGLAFTLDICPLPSRQGFDFDAAFLVVARLPKLMETRAGAVAAALYGLTPSESAVAGLLVGGLSAQAIAERQGVGLGTIRTHIRRLLDKTGSRSQLEFVTALLAHV